jgi:hypothetical protein
MLFNFIDNQMIQANRGDDDKSREERAALRLGERLLRIARNVDNYDEESLRAYLINLQEQYEIDRSEHSNSLVGYFL